MGDDLLPAGKDATAGGDQGSSRRAAGAPLSDAENTINQRIFETSLDLILVVDRNGNFLRVSPSSQAILGFQPEEMVGRSARQFIYLGDLDSTRAEMRAARRGRLTRHFDCSYVSKTGEVVPLAWMGVWSEPEQQHFFIGRDMRERLKLEQRLVQGQKMEAIGQLTGGIAHDFNNLLTVIIGMSEILTGAVAGQPALESLIKSIDEAASRGAEMTQRMLAFARKQPLQARRIDLNDIVSRTAEMLKRTLGEHIEIDTSAPGGLWAAQADPLQVENAILNLAVNARDAMPKGGRLLIETANVHLDDEYAQTNTEVAPGDYVAVIVTDTGTGMTPEVVEHAFEPYFTTKDVGQGTGLGLSMVYGFAKQSRGHLKIYSEIGHGTSVRLYLPRAAAVGTAATDVAAPREKSNAHGHESILLVEDDAAVRRVALNVLEGLGYRVKQAPDGRAALLILEAPGEFDLLFTDLVMPNGIGGQELWRRARAMRPGLKALFTTGYSEQFVKACGDAEKGVPVLSKPYRRETLATAIRNALGGGTNA
jgi:PAS domain S-box-containing protein